MSPGEDTPLLQTRALKVGYAGRVVLPEVHLAVHPGAFWAVVGRNGSGKTTFLRSALGLLPSLGGDLVRRPGLRIGYVPQRSEVDPTVPARVVDLVRAGRDRGWSFLRPGLGAGAEEAVRRALKDTDLVGLDTRPFSDLSEGQKQRVLMARALVSDPDLLVLDEPTSAMDFIAEQAIYALLERIRHERRLAILMVSHHVPVLAAHATHVLYVDGDDGLVLAGPFPEIVNHPRFQRHYGVVVEAAAPAGGPAHG